MKAIGAMALLAVAGVARADPGPLVVTGGARLDARAAVAVGTESVGLGVGFDKPDSNRTSTVEYVYRWQGGTLGGERTRIFIARPAFRLFLRDTNGVSVITRGGVALGLSKGFGLGARMGTNDGSFSVVLSPLASFDASWVVREGTGGLSARIPVGGEVAAEAKLGRALPFVMVRSFADLWPHRAPAYRYEAFAGIGVSFDLPKPRAPAVPPSAPNHSS